VSADEGGFLLLWDIHDGSLKNKVDAAHGCDVKRGMPHKITAGCFTYALCRLVTSGTDGKCKIWNFYNM